MRVPADPRRERLGFVVESERGEIVPRWIAAKEFHATRLEHQAEQEPPKKPKGGSGKNTRAVNARTQGEWRKEYCQKPRFQQENVPLETKELAANCAKRQID